LVALGGYVVFHVFAFAFVIIKKKTLYVRELGRCANLYLINHCIYPHVALSMHIFCNFGFEINLNKPLRTETIYSNLKHYITTCRCSIGSLLKFSFIKAVTILRKLIYKLLS